MHNSELYRVNANGSQLRQLTNDPCQNTAAAWSPDGLRITFNCATEGLAEIHMINADGSGGVMLTHHSIEQPVNDFSPVWSPDGQHIAFVSDRKGDYAIYIMNIDGSQVIRLMDGTGNDSSPRWSPDGTQIIFARGDYLKQEIYLISLTHIFQPGIRFVPINLTNHQANDSSFVWQP